MSKSNSVKPIMTSQKHIMLSSRPLATFNSESPLYDPTMKRDSVVMPKFNKSVTPIDHVNENANCISCPHVLVDVRPQTEDSYGQHPTLSTERQHDLLCPPLTHWAENRHRGEPLTTCRHGGRGESLSTCRHGARGEPLTTCRHGVYMTDEECPDFEHKVNKSKHWCSIM